MIGAELKQVRVSVENPHHLDVLAQERNGRRGDHRVRGRRGPACEQDRGAVEAMLDDWRMVEGKLYVHLQIRGVRLLGEWFEFDKTILVSEDLKSRKLLTIVPKNEPDVKKAKAAENLGKAIK